MSLWSKLFGGGSSDGGLDAEPVAYKGYRIYAAPMPATGGHRIAARIEKGTDGETQVYELIRADVLQERDAAVTASTDKARQIIDEQGDGIFR